jgi:hypothetical protein
MGRRVLAFNHVSIQIYTSKTHLSRIIPNFFFPKTKKKNNNIVEKNSLIVIMCFCSKYNCLKEEDSFLAFFLLEK